MTKARIYTDGSALGNPGPGGYGVLLFLPKQPVRELQAGYRLTTNNRMEIQGVISALKALPQPGMEVEIYTDSQYVVHAVEKGWLQKWAAKDFRKAKNADLWRSYLKASDPHKVHLVWIRGHSGHKENEHCDQLAKAAAATPTRIDKVYEDIFLSHRASPPLFSEKEQKNT